MITINLNQTIKVKLTQEGFAVHKKDYEQHALIQKQAFKIDLPPYKEPEVDEEGYSEFQLWDFMSIFGGDMYNGAPNLVENNEIHYESDDILLIR